MTDREILVELRSERKNNKRVLRRLVEERVRVTSNNKFSLQDINYYADYLGMSKNELLHGVLRVNECDYMKFLNGYIKFINSEKYNQDKLKYLNKLKNIQKYRINWNKKNYFNRGKLMMRAEKAKVNVLDFSANILSKNKQCIIRVLNDTTNKCRFSVGHYETDKLPNEYIEKNYNILNRIAKVAVWKAHQLLGKRMSKEDFNEGIQSTLVYIFESGNDKDKFGIPKIKNADFKPKHGKILYIKSYFHEIGEICKLKRTSEYNDKIRYSNNADNSDADDFNYLQEKWSLTNLQIKILKLMDNGYKPDEIMGKINISSDEYENAIEEIKLKMKQVN